MSATVASVPLAEVLRDLDLESSVLRFYQAQFREYLTPTRPGHIQRALSAPDVETLRLIHFLMHVREFSAAETQAYLRKRHVTKVMLDTDAAAPAASAAPAAAQSARKYAKVIAFTSGKGGVGKSSLSLNIAAELSRMGFRTALVDADLGLANLHILANLSPEATLDDVVADRVTLRQALTPGPWGVNVLAGASGLLRLAELSARDRARLLEQLQTLEEQHDVVLIDTGAGLSHQVLDFVASADEAVVVTTPEATAIADAYAMIKVLSKRHSHIPVRLLVNRVASAYEAMVVARRVVRCVERFLDAEVQEVGYVLDDPAVARAVQERRPYVIANPRSKAAKSTRRVAENLMAVERRRGSSGTEQSTLSRWLSVVRPGPAVVVTEG